LSIAKQPFALGIAVAVAALRALAGTPAAAQNEPPPPSASNVCPSIEDDGLICSSDKLGMSGNCANFVTAAGHLAALYRSEREKLSGSREALLSTSWWGCGPGSLYDVKRLLVRLGTPEALAVLKQQPYASLPEVPPPPPPPSPNAPLTCIDIENPVDRNLCIGVNLEAARTAHQEAFAQCKARVAGPLLQDLVDSEADFERQARALCEADTSEAGEGAKVRAFDRARCLIQAYNERTKTMFAMHPECTPGP